MFDLFTQPPLSLSHKVERERIELHKRENSSENQQILEDNKDLLTNQCIIVLRALVNGERLTTSEALIRYGVGDLRARVRDCIKNGINIQKKILEKRYKEYWLKEEDIERVKLKYKL